MNMYGVIVFVSLAISPILAQVDQTFPGLCPTTTNPLLNETRYAGRWYEIKRFNNTLITGQCGIPQHTLVLTGGFNVAYVATNLTSNLNTTTTLQLRQPSVGGTAGNYEVQANNTKQTIGQKILDTDYDTYSIVWGCSYTSGTNRNTQRLSIYSRNNTLNATVIAKVNSFLTAAGIESAALINIEQDNKKCGRGSATTLVVPVILSCIIAMLLTKTL